MKRKPWVKLYREERGRFAQLPLFARALAKQLLILADDDGGIHTGNRTPEEAIAWVAGADRSDRRMLKKYVPMLIDVGYIVVEPQRIVIADFELCGPERGYVNRQRILSRDDWTCRYCTRPLTNAIAEVDHVIPVSRGGTDDEWNLVASCRRCNRSKSDTPLADWMGGVHA